MKLNLTVILLTITVVFGFGELCRGSEQRESLAVMDIEAKYGVNKELADALSMYIRDEISNQGEYAVLSREDLQAIMNREQLLQAMGCSENGNCLVDFGRTLGTNYMIVGAISLIGKTYKINLRLLDTQGEDAGLIRRVSAECRCPEEGLIDTIKSLSGRVMGKTEVLVPPSAKLPPVVQTSQVPLESLPQKSTKEPLTKREQTSKSESQRSGQAELPLSAQQQEDFFLDQASGLEWIASQDVSMSFDATETWLKEINKESAGWRLPTVEEITGLYRNGFYADLLPDFFHLTGWKIWCAKSKLRFQHSYTVHYRMVFDFRTGRSDWYRLNDFYGKNYVGEEFRGMAVRSRMSGKDVPNQ